MFGVPVPPIMLQYLAPPLIEARHIHRIVALPQAESWTLVHAGPHERTTMFWRFDDRVQRRAWNARRWTTYRSPIAGDGQIFPD